MKTRTPTRSLVAGVVLCLASSTALAQPPSIVDTKHNLSSAGLGTQTNSFSGTDEVCVFCHTPHGADTSANPPLWNRTLPAPGTFQTYAALGTTTMDGEVAPVGSVSIACLSCHDGTQAMNVMINAPGSTNYDPAGFTLAGTWTGPASGATPVGSLDYGGNNIVNIGQDLRDDHPVGVEYAGGGCGAAGVTCSPQGGDTLDADFEDALRIGTGVDLWYVDVDADGTREKTDMILYTRTDFTAAGPSVECASCHDPHGTVSPMFMRTSNNQSGVCLACHIK